MDRFICFVENMLIVVGAGMFGYWAGYAQDNLSLECLVNNRQLNLVACSPACHGTR